jgi:hypothetical protein
VTILIRRDIDNKRTTKIAAPENIRTAHVGDRQSTTRKTHIQALWSYVVRPNSNTHTSANRALPVEHVPFTKGLRGSACCRCGGADETVEHVLLACPRWTDERKTLRESVGDRCNDVLFSLVGYGTRKVGQSDQRLDGKRENWTADIKIVKATVEFFQSTGRLEYNHRPDDWKVIERGCYSISDSLSCS